MCACPECITEPHSCIILRAELIQDVSSRHLVISPWFPGFAKEDNVFVPFILFSLNAITLRNPPVYSILQHFKASFPCRAIWSE